MGLCYRCEYRALVMEGEHGPRYECNAKDHEVGSCYMFRPVKPPVLQKSPGYKGRPRLEPIMCCARERMAGIANCGLGVKKIGRDKLSLYWIPGNTFGTKKKASRRKA